MDLGQVVQRSNTGATEELLPSHLFYPGSEGGCVSHFSYTDENGVKTEFQKSQ